MELKIEDVSFDSIIPGVQAGKYSMGMAGMTVTDERLEKVNFSTSYAKGIQSVSSYQSLFIVLLAAALPT
jgi:polar amino acid transport system substrate-binding protein